MRLSWCRTLTLLVVALQPLLSLCATQQDPLARGKELMKAGKLKQAEVLLQTASQANPNSSALHGLLGEVLFKEQRYEDSVQQLGLAAQANPDSLKYAVLLSEALIGWRHFAVAVEFLHAVEPRFSQYPEFHYDLGFAYYNEGHVKDAQQEFERTLQLAPHLAQGQFMLASCMVSQGEFSSAEPIFVALTKTYPTKAAYWAGLAQLLSLENRNAEAIRASQRALSLAPGNTHVQLVAATALMQAGEVSSAVTMFEKLEHVNGKLIAVHLALGRLYRQQGRIELAHKEAELAQQLQGESTAQPGQQSPAGAEYPAPH